MSRLKPSALYQSVWSFLQSFYFPNQSLRAWYLSLEANFMMGKNSTEDVNYKPAHLVKIDSFLMDQYEVTNAQYLKFCEATNHQLPEFWGMEKV
ncbi:MAG: SUMF1/EgtB/PvdO family nonheme iron enzyme [Bacteroidales bacterium]|nr:SUMF1/EgtB/PvdO family nonheme iron enzyme [Bacteroidales bacterium]